MIHFVQMIPAKRQVAEWLATCQAYVSRNQHQNVEDSHQNLAPPVSNALTIRMMVVIHEREEPIALGSAYKVHGSRQDEHRGFNQGGAARK
jgi:hypothetical protein